MSWGMVAGAAVSVVGGIIANKNNKKANGQAQGAADANYYANTQNMQPYLNAGTGALNQLSQLNSGNYSSFQESPDYQFTLQQGLQGLDRSAAARGSLYSGGQQADIMQYGQGLASQQYNNYYNKLASLAGQGQSAASALAGVGNTYANATANNAYQGAANSNALTGLLTGVGSNLASNINYGGGGRQSSYTGNGTGAGSINQFGNNLAAFKGMYG
ncbi:hypothetical protein ACQR5V_21355 [Xanthomonas oryzae pv. oryzicola]|uniref:hypothetical protein n=1 Tax=Xanthomonas oryzae TaxID=347 RepID=UPI0005CF0B1C|nr:hypothetical protein [Xanthomonas oryzae]AVU02511.1 hypothetical protein C0L90_08625 [Xanthomonas oryzae pv. oryzae]OWB26868.1 hypothetical protein XocBAI21_17570 [Xanthomonas oryzae pv. oryzicola]QBI15713.1 hypothetical protein EYR03_08705 [Xanthomonas oryzae pv. oryzae]QBI15755.1 hypothetical protein EYR03_08985 [Xanthomonas oryzae pv. oryzae]QBN53597.1 hypothetical protein EBA08_08670 [Xanthomonas oryzae pv. oryzae]